MANALNKTLASVLVAAAAVGGTAANAQTRQEKADAERQRIAACYTVGQEKGVERLPLTNKALQQDRGEKLLGCVYNAAAGEELIVTKAYDLADARDATAYGRESAKLKADEVKAAQKLAGQDQQRGPDGNVVTDTAKEVKDTATTVKKGADAVNGAAKAIEGVNKTLKKFGF